MKVLPLGIAALAMAALASPPASAQIFEYNQGEYYIEGVRTNCPEVQTAIYNRADTLIEVEDGLIMKINGPTFDTLPPGLRLFVYYDECAMLFYRDFALADARAIAIGLEEQWLTATDIETACTTTLLADTGWANAPDPARCEAMYQVMREALR
ncbi:MAG: hypothetical protein IT534_10540 [Bauldia sp.]|nr:hypothetical protein [Bauldia sp.]